MAAPHQAMTEPELLDRMRLLAEAFRPAAPIDRRGLFSGRTDQLAELFSVVGEPGQHAVVYGERGVGKTSLVTVVAGMLSGSGVMTVRATCDSSDDYRSVWRKALGELGMSAPSRGVGFAPTVAETSSPASALLGEGEVTPHVVLRALETISRGRALAIFVDEFDRLHDPAARALFADTIKLLSDRVVPATIVLVGVADDVGELIREHRSVERALAQIRMPRMSREELAEIATRGIDSARMTIERRAVNRVATLSQGLPHYTHLLAQLSAQAALAARRADVVGRDVDAAVERAIDRAQQSVAEAYRRATAARGPELVLACALAEEDEFGFFTPGDLPEDSDGLDELAAPDIGVLQKRRESGSDRYRFLNPLLQPYVVMRGLSEGLVKTRDL
jgi:energy-coupling factor transporter ATP-binding protein EcfA2